MCGVPKHSVWGLSSLGFEACAAYGETRSVCMRNSRNPALLLSRSSRVARAPVQRRGRHTRVSRRRCVEPCLPRLGVEALCGTQPGVR